MHRVDRVLQRAKLTELSPEQPTPIEFVDAGVDYIVGLNCIGGPATMMPLLCQIRAKVKTHMAALPVPYRTSEKGPSFQSLCDPHWHYAEGSRPFPIALDPFTCNRFEIAEFGRQAARLGEWQRALRRRAA